MRLTNRTPKRRVKAKLRDDHDEAFNSRVDDSLFP